ncbi:MAG: OmpH family outer membrane protein [Candidatus Omnitrophica bacterium]|nr:OmpH family outer membrane protein [Candidatus Omnitrophota bacterium]
MKIFKVLTVFILAAIFLTVGFRGEATAAGKIGFVDLSKIFDGYQKTKEYDEVLGKKQAEYEKSRNAKIEKLKEAQGKLALLKESEKEKAGKEMEQMKSDLLTYDQAERTELTKDRDEKIREILLEIEKQVSEFAKKEGYDFIINDRVLIYSNDALDITEPILKQLNAGYTKK